MSKEMKRKEEIFKQDVNKEVEEQNTEESSAKDRTTGIQRTKTGTVYNTSYVYVRKGPNKDADILEVMKEGDKVAIIGKSFGFYKVNTASNQAAYIASDFLKEE